MLLSQLAKVTEHTLVGEDREIANIEYDSRKVHEGDLFCCVTGTFSDGHEYAPMAKEAGAAALVVERRILTCRSLSCQTRALQWRKWRRHITAILPGK